MRVKEKVENIDYTETKEFFKHRAGKFREDNPYSVTMYQDHNEKLVRDRNQKEVERLKPLLELGKQSRVLDVGCGIGRWGDAITEEIEEYCGLDFSSELIKIAQKRTKKENYFFCEGPITELEKVLLRNNKGKYNVALLVGILMYVNDEDMELLLEQLEHRCMEHATICIREPIGLGERLTLKDFFSEDLNDNYNAIYRTRDELAGFFQKGLLNKGFKIAKEGFLFQETDLNNRKETMQYYFLLRR